MGWTLKGVEILFSAVFSRFTPDRCVADDVRKPVVERTCGWNCGTGNTPINLLLPCCDSACLVPSTSYRSLLHSNFPVVSSAQQVRTMFCHTVKLRFMDIFNSNSNINKNRTEENLTQMFWTFNLLDWFRRLSEGIKGKTLFCHASNQFFFSIVNKKNKNNFYRRWVFSLIDFVLITCKPQVEGKTQFCHDST